MRSSIFSTKTVESQPIDITQLLLNPALRSTWRKCGLWLFPRKGGLLPFLQTLQLVFLLGSALVPFWVSVDLYQTVALVDQDKQWALRIAALGGVTFGASILLFGYRLIEAKKPELAVQSSEAREAKPLNAIEQDSK